MCRCGAPIHPQRTVEVVVSSCSASVGRLAIQPGPPVDGNRTPPPVHEVQVAKQPRNRMESRGRGHLSDLSLRTGTNPSSGLRSGPVVHEGSPPVRHKHVRAVSHSGRHTTGLLQSLLRALPRRERGRPKRQQRALLVKMGRCISRRFLRLLRTNFVPMLSA